MYFPLKSAKLQFVGRKKMCHLKEAKLTRQCDEKPSHWRHSSWSCGDVGWNFVRWVEEWRRMYLSRKEDEWWNEVWRMFFEVWKLRVVFLVVKEMKNLSWISQKGGKGQCEIETCMNLISSFKRWRNEIDQVFIFIMHVKSLYLVTERRSKEKIGCSVIIWECNNFNDNITI